MNRREGAYEEDSKHTHFLKSHTSLIVRLTGTAIVTYTDVAMVTVYIYTCGWKEP